MRLENTGRHINTDEVKLKTPALPLHALPSRMAGQPSRLIRISTEIYTTVHSVGPLYFIYQYTLCNKCVVMRYIFPYFSGHGLQIGVNKHVLKYTFHAINDDALFWDHTNKIKFTYSLAGSVLLMWQQRYKLYPQSTLLGVIHYYVMFMCVVASLFYLAWFFLFFIWHSSFN